MNEMGKRTSRMQLVLVLILVSCSILPFLPVKGEKVEKLFSLTMLAPFGGNPFYVQEAQLIANELPKIGIDTTLLLVSYDIGIPRLFDSPTRADYANGGFDIGCLRWSGGLIPNPRQFYHSAEAAPEGDNYFVVPENTANDDGAPENACQLAQWLVADSAVLFDNESGHLDIGVLDAQQGPDRCAKDIGDD